jgi:predicted RNA-binding Zn ribbon-like protein
VQLIGGHPVLDFVNVAPESFHDALLLAVATGVASRPEARQLQGRHDAELQQLSGLRALLRGVFATAEPRRVDLDALAQAWAVAASCAHLRPARRGGRLALTFDVAGSGAAVLRHRLTQKAIELLTSDLKVRVGTCGSCGWLFLDTSKNRSRRWCSMRLCGGAAKSRAYYRRRTGQRRA